ncbi:MAG: hypothetical protein M3160_06140 [Candidatus Eremiobacteraeota bacterium]|nr:hypothetical protein [Candidatus Eremiobacteraeota bacterium]
MPAVAVGVDAGGSSTVAALSRNGKFVRTAAGAGSSPSVLGVQKAAAVINDVLERLLCEEDPDVICIGAAGAGRSTIARALSTFVRNRFPASYVEVYDDAQMGLRAAGVGTPAIILIAGTGSIALADTATQTIRAGGLGYLLGDEGSGFAIGLAAARLLGQFFDARVPADDFIESIREALEVHSRDELCGRIYGDDLRVGKIAALAPLALSNASSGSRSAARIVQSAALELAELLKTVARKADLLAAQPSIVLTGGLLRENSMLSFLLETRVHNDFPGASILRRPQEPYMGALETAHTLVAERNL